MRVTKDREERRQELMATAERLFLADGYVRTGVSDIVRETRVAQGTFYYHFKSKEDILVAIVQKTVAELETRVVAVIRQSSLSASQRLGQVLRVLVDALMQKRDLVAFIHTDENALLHYRLMGTTTRMLQVHLVSLVREGIETGEFHVPHVEETVGFLLSGLGGLLHEPALLADPANWPKVRETAIWVLERALGMEPGGLSSNTSI